MEFRELSEALRYSDGSYTASYAEKLFKAVQQGNAEKMLSELEAAQYLEAAEIEDLFGMRIDNLIPELSPREIVFAMKTLIHLHGIRVSVTKLSSPERIWKDVQVGDILSGTITRKTNAGYLVWLDQFEASAFLPQSAASGPAFDLPVNGQFEIIELDKENRRIVVSVHQTADN